MKQVKWFVVCWVVLSAWMAVGCSDDSSDDNSNGGSDAQAYVASCQNLCVKQDAANCDTGGFDITVDDCKALCQVFSGFTGDCAAKYKAYGECTDAQADACMADTACSAQMDAAATACGM